MQTKLAPGAQDFDVKPGDIYSLGDSHRLMCGDATNKEDVKRLFDGRKPTLVVTSPPYAKQRDYDRPIACWDSMMLGALDGHAFADDVQMLVNLGHFHRKGEVIHFWDNWIVEMRKQGWLHHAQYVWHKTVCLPHAVRTRLTPNFEYIIHLNQQTRLCTPSVPTTGAGDSALIHKSRQRTRNGEKSKQRQCWTHIGNMKLQGAVISTSILHPKEATSHPAQYPVAMPLTLIKAFKSAPDLIAYDPFVGSGTTLHAAEQEGVTGLGMEISPAYTAIALARWAKAYPDQPIIKVAVAP